MTTPSIYKSPAGEQAILARYEAALARWPVPYTTLTIPTRHGDTFIIASGNQMAPPLVLLHGAGTNSAMWAGDIAEYSRHYRVLAVDLLGEPGKSAPNRPSWAGAAYAEWLEDVLNGLQLSAATIIGLSQGAWVALKFAAACPERVTSLVVLSPGGIVPDKLSFVVRAIPLSLLGGWGIKRLNHLVLGGQAVPAEVEDTMKLLMTHFKPRIGALPAFTDTELQRLTMPVQLVMGKRDALRDADKIAARMQPLIPHLTVTIMPEGGHALVNARRDILPFLATSSPASR